MAVPDPPFSGARTDERAVTQNTGSTQDSASEAAAPSALKRAWKWACRNQTQGDTGNSAPSEAASTQVDTQAQTPSAEGRPKPLTCTTQPARSGTCGFGAGPSRSGLPGPIGNIIYH